MADKDDIDKVSKLAKEDMAKESNKVKFAVANMMTEAASPLILILEKVDKVDHDLMLKMLKSSVNSLIMTVTKNRDEAFQVIDKVKQAMIRMDKMLNEVE